jgi:hypothetical protein
MTDIVLNETITYLPNYQGHWKGEAWMTWHAFGVSVHRSKQDAERYNIIRADLDRGDTHLGYDS